MTIMFKDELTTLAELWDMPMTLDPAPIEANRLMLEVKRYQAVMRSKMLELESLDNTSTTGVMQVQPIIELYERAIERSADFIKFAMKYELDERRTQLLEAQARDIATAVLSTVMDPTLQLEDWQVDKVRSNLQRAMEDLSPSLQPDWMKDFIDEETGEYE